MRLYAIGDLHLPGGDSKPMDVFGPQWEGHFERICQDWRSRVTEEDAVLLPGDFTWAMTLKAALPDLQAIAALPGRKIICKGNHDLWWPSMTQLELALPKSMTALQHSAVDLGPCVVCGTRGWTLPTPDQPLSKEDGKIFARELIRLEMALKEATRLADGKPIVAMLHYPPLYVQLRDTEVTALLEKYGMRAVVYGHLHGDGIRAGFNGTHNGIRYRLVSCDSIDFRLA